MSPEKWRKQYTQRGWTKDTIQNTIDKPYTTRQGTNRTTGNKTIVYYNQNGSHVIVDNDTGKVIQVSDRTNPNWKPDSSIQDPYIPD
ncbi:colicin E5-related ribonuclease [Paenibacillus larvae]|uniref:colicin E5-related ribonuclease n=1 Tax=Paenibacillus larvae TaxID=1464 RepID=UPI0039900EB6